MISDRTISVIASALLSICCHGQITLLSQTSPDQYIVTTLTSHGLKWVQETPTSIQLHNLDMTLFRSMPLPTPPPGYYISNILYISEALFDNDPLTIEYIAMLNQTGGGNGLGFAVADETGAVLLNLNDGNLGIAAGLGFVNTPIFATDSGAYMVLRNGQNTELYQLPGHIPCGGCASFPMTAGGDDLQPGPGGHFNVHPNPADRTLEINLAAGSGQRTPTFMLFDMEGRVVLERSLEVTGRTTLDISALPAGAYTCLLVVDGLPVGAKRLVFVR